jgi:hypothetical protein
MMKTKSTVRPFLFSSLFLFISSAIIVLPRAGLCIDYQGADSIAPQVSERAAGHNQGDGILQGLLGFRRRGDAPEHGTSPIVKSVPSLAAKDHPTVQPNESLTSAIQRTTSPKRAAALRLAEKGRQYLLQKQHHKAVSYFEKALGLEASPYLYYYLSRAHYHLGQYAASANFLDVASSLLAAQPAWATAVAAMRAQYPQTPPDVNERSVARVKIVRPAAAVERSGM